MSKTDFGTRAAGRLQALLLEEDWEATGFKAARGASLGTDGAYVGRIISGERSSVGIEVVGHAARLYRLSADYFLDDGPIRLDESSYVRTRHDAGEDDYLRLAMDACDLSPSERAAIAGVDWSKLPPGPETYKTVCRAITFLRAAEAAPLPPIPPGAGPSIAERRREVARRPQEGAAQRPAGRRRGR
jgi:hypothetical protein